MIHLTALRFLLGFTMGWAEAGDVPKPEHPRPDFERSAWVNLNGVWDFEFDSKDVGQKEHWFAGDKKFARSITVPFGWESKLSGIVDLSGKKIGWYRRTVAPPVAWAGKRVWLHFGAVDWQAEVWVNGKHVGGHAGGYTPFSFDITELAPPGKPATVVLRAFDPTDPQLPTGKQVGWYTPTSGVWQTVWLEATPETYLEDFTLIPTKTAEGWRIQVNATVRGVVHENDSVGFVVEGRGPINFAINGKKEGRNVEFAVPIADARPWTPDNPVLYQAKLRVSAGNEIDEVKTYFALRTIGRGKIAGSTYEHILLNGEPIYLRGALDQSFNPEGVYTAPTDAFLQADLNLAKKMGLNFLRIHIKPDEPRRLYWADRLGLLLMQDMPNTWAYSDRGRKAWEQTMRETIARDKNHPSIIAWCLFNETWGLCNKDTDEFKRNRGAQEWVAAMFDEAKKLDPSRLVEDHSPCNYDKVKSDIHSWHFYIDEDSEAIQSIEHVVANTFPGSGHNTVPGRVQGSEPLINSEYGSVSSGGGDRDVSWGFRHLTNQLRRHPKIQGYVYTELTDVEWEHNGFANYDRTLKEFGYGAWVPGMTPADLQGADFIGFQGPAGIEVEEGAAVRIHPFVSHFSTLPGTMTVRTTIRGVGDTGRSYETPSATQQVQSKPYSVTPLDPMIMPLPTDRPFVGAVALELLDGAGTRIAANYVNLISRSVLHGDLPNVEVWDQQTLALHFDPNDFAELNWPGARANGEKFRATGKGSVEYHLRLPAPLRSQAESLEVVVEAAADAGAGKVDWPSRPHRQDHPQTDERKWPSRLTVCIDGVDAKFTLGDEPNAPPGILPDDPADARGVLSHYRHKDPGSYGYLLRAMVPLGASTEERTTIRFSADRGLALFGMKAGRYPLRPTLLVHLKAPVDLSLLKLAPTDSVILDRRLDRFPAILPPGHVWRYTEKAPAPEWLKPDFAAADWKTGPGGFGTTITRGLQRHTEWHSDAIWLRTEGNLPANIGHVRMRLFHDEDVEIYINGKRLLNESGFVTQYEDRWLEPAERALFHAGKNLIAVHCKQTTGGQGIDLQLSCEP